MPSLAKHSMLMLEIIPGPFVSLFDFQEHVDRLEQEVNTIQTISRSPAAPSTYATIFPTPPPLYSSSDDCRMAPLPKRKRRTRSLAARQPATSSFSATMRLHMDTRMVTASKVRISVFFLLVSCVLPLCRFVVAEVLSPFLVPPNGSRSTCGATRIPGKLTLVLSHGGPLSQLCGNSSH